MKIIVQANKDYLKLLSITSDANASHFFPSTFILRNETEDGTLLCNTLTGEMVLLSPTEKELFDHLATADCSLLEELIKHRYVVSDNCIEYQTADQLRSMMMIRRESRKTITHYNILPTTFCNARCFYCYENGIRKVHMSEKTAMQLVGFIVAHHGNEDVKLSWFGGEPMVGMCRIDQICKELKKREVPFKSDMISNGYLFNEELVEQAKRVWNLKSIQITLDGTEEVYNRTKAYSETSANPYLRVLRNISIFLNNEIHVFIRLNLGIYNSTNLELLINELSERFKGKKNLDIYVSELDDGVGYEPIHNSQMDLQLQDEYTYKIQEQLESHGWLQFKPEKLPQLRLFSCMADDPNTVQCTPEGILSKCEDQIYDHVVGNLNEGITDQNTIKWWRQRTVFDECKTCPLYPSCRLLLINCPLRRTECHIIDKKRYISRYRELMLKEYEKWKQSQACAEKV